jgi:hypothetical protein
MNNLFSLAGLPTSQQSAPIPNQVTPVNQHAAENAEDIPKEELMQLCMKMNKKMQAMETKGKELVKKKSVLLQERRKLLEIIKSASGISMICVDDQDLNLSELETGWCAWDTARREQVFHLEQQLAMSDKNAFPSNAVDAVEPELDGGVNNEVSIFILKNACEFIIAWFDLFVLVVFSRSDLSLS